MAFPKGHKYGNRFSSTNQPKKKRSNPINAVVVEFTKEHEIPKADDVRRMYLALAAMKKAQVEKIFNDEEQPLIARVTARAILSKNGFDYIEKMLDRTYGKPTQVTENYNENMGIGEGPKIIFEMGKSDE
jgi:ribosome assembly protein YihI (activator of Der GTPase)